MLSFEYQDRSGEYRAEYRGLIVKAIQDSDCFNPWEDSDGLSPMIVYADGWQDYSGRYDIESPLAALSDAKLGRQWKALCDAIGIDPAEADSEVKESQAAYGGRLAEYRREYLESALSDLKPSGGRSWGAACDYLSALESIWQIAGVAALEFQRNGYSQGDSWRGLLVALPEWRSAMGIKPAAPMAEDLEAQADLFGSWARGDCYGFSIETEAGDSLDSYWGFIGDEFDKSGLAEAAQSAADYIADSSKRRRNGRLAELIRNRVPLHNRPAELEAAGEFKGSF